MMAHTQDRGAAPGSARCPGNNQPAAGAPAIRHRHLGTRAFELITALSMTAGRGRPRGRSRGWPI